MIALLLTAIVLFGLFFFTSLRAKNRRGVAVSGIICGLALLALVGVKVAQGVTDNATDVKNAAQARAAHDQRLAWQRAHPREYAAQLAHQRESATRVAAAQRAEDERARKNQQEANARAKLPENKDPCTYANGRIKQGWSDFDGAAYQSAFDDAVKGLAANERCDQSDEQTLNEGFLLSVKGLSEHYLSSGDSRTDLHQAETQLEECQTNPHYYGTHTGAVCETQQENDIKSTTNWDVYGG